MERVTRNNATFKEKERIALLINQLSQGETHPLRLCLERKHDGKLTKIENVSNGKKHERDFKCHFDNKSVASIEVKTSGKGTDLNTTLNYLANIAAINYQGSVEDDLSDYYKTREAFLNQHLNELELGEYSLEKTQHRKNKVLKKIAPPNSPLRKEIKTLWHNFFIEQMQEKIEGISPEFLSILLDHKMLPRIIFYLESNKICFINEEKVRAKRLKSKWSKNSLKGLDHNDDEVCSISPAHWKNGVGIQTFAVNGWLKQDHIHNLYDINSLYVGTSSVSVRETPSDIKCRNSNNIYKIE